MSESLDRTRSRPCVVMMAGNDILPDVRVLKYAHSVAKLGPEVVAVGIGGPRLTGERIVGDVRIVCPAVSERAAASGWRFRLSAAKPWFTDATTYRRSLARWEYASRESAGLPGRATRDAMRPGVRKNTATRPSTASRLLTSLRSRSLGFRRRILALRARPLRWARNTTSTGTGGGRAWRIRAYRRVGMASWRATMPEILDAELTLGPVLDELAPDVIHVHDVYLLGVGARAAHRAALDGRQVRLVYDAHEYVRGTAAVAARRVAAYEDLESEFIGDADRVITVSEPLATLLRRDYRLSQLPDVVLNAPVDVPEHASVTGVRDLVGLTADVPLLVYGGGVNRARGVDTIVKALPLVPEAHLVVVSRGNSVVMDLQKLAATLGVGDRLHVVPYVEADLVPRYLESATVGVSSLLRSPNHDVAVTNKFCEYLAAGLPIVTSDTPAQATLVRDLGLGAVYTAGDPSSLAAALHDVLREAQSLHERIAGDAALRFRFSWAAQADVVRTVYDELLGGLPDQAWHEDVLHLTGSLGAR